MGRYETKYSLGQVVAWKIGGKPMVVTNIRQRSEFAFEYVCSYADNDGNPQEGTFMEHEIESYMQPKIGF